MSPRSESQLGAPAVVVSSPLGRVIQLFGLGDADVVRRLTDDLRRTTALLSGHDGARAAGAQDALASLERAVTEQAEAAERVAELAGRVERRLSVTTDGQSPPRTRGVEERLTSVELALDRLMSESDPGAAPVADVVRADPVVAEVVETAVVPEPTLTAADCEPTRTAESLMHLVDRVGTAASGRDTPDPLIGWLHRRLISVLDGEGVTVIHDEGRFDATRHEVVDTRAAERVEQADRICATVRPGFAAGERVLRPQQVVLWQWEV